MTDEPNEASDMRCTVCGLTVEKQTFLLIAKGVFGTAELDSVAVLDAEDEFDTDAGNFSGILLHWPSCAHTYFEALTVEGKYLSGRKDFGPGV